MNEDIDIGAELYDKIHADFLKQLGEARELRSMADVSGYSGQVGRALSRAIAANLSPDVLPDGRLYYNIARSILEPSLRENHELVNGAAEQVQRELDEREGIRIKPVRPEFPTERVNDVISAASAEGIPWEKTLRRVTSPAETITMSFADDFMKANAEKRSRAGFDTFIDRQGGGKCCPWCAKLIGHFKYPDNVPKDVYRRHDNCTCTVTYGTKGGARQDVWSKVTWAVPPAKELHRGAVQGAEKVPHRLTGGANGGIIDLDIFRTRDDPMREVLGSAYENNREELFKIIDELEAKGVEILITDRNRTMGYQPGVSLSNPSPGQIKMDREASISAWRHERRHALDDEASGWLGRLLLADPNTRYEWEKRAYAEEIELANQLNRPDMVERLNMLLEEERRKIYGK